MPDRTWEQGGGIARRLQEVAPGEYAEEVYARDAWSAAIGMGGAHIIGTGRVTLAVAGNVRAIVANPTGSGKNVTVIGITAFGTALGWAQAYLDPTAGVPATAIRPTLPMHPASAAAVSQVRVDTDAATALSGGTDTGVTIALPAGTAREIKPIGRTLAPGQSLGLNIPFAGSADMAFALYVVEE